MFQYFTGEIFGRARAGEPARADARGAPALGVAATTREALSGNPEAPLVLDYVYRRHLFTDRRRLGDQPVYQFHALFREFLLERGQAAAVGRKSVHAALDRAAGQLVARGDFDAAAALYIEAQGVARARRPHAARRALAARGRPAQGARALARRDAARKSAMREPRLALGEAYAVMYDEPARCKALLERAYAGLRRAQRRAPAAPRRRRGRRLPLLRMGGLRAARPLDRRARRACSTPDPPYLSTADALRIRGALLIALLFRQPDNPRIDDAARTVEALLEAPDILDVPVNDRVNAASILFNYMNWKTKGDERRRADRARRAVARRSRGHRGEPRVVAGASRVQRADPRPLRALAEDHEGHRGVRRGARAQVGAGRDLPRRGDGARVERGRARRRRRARQAARGARARRAAWTSPISATRKRAC